MYFLLNAIVHFIWIFRKQLFSLAYATELLFYLNSLVFIYINIFCNLFTCRLCH